jgi:CRP/FNR family transcriptional regulator, dissimilatory nitrate respiration regulator
MDLKLNNVVKNCMLFENMAEADLAMLLGCLSPRIRKFAKNDIANSEGDPFEGIGIVLSGQAAVVRENSSGSRTILTILKPGDLFGEMAAFSGNGRWPATIVTQSACDIMYMPPDKILGQCEKACTGHRTLIMNMLVILSGRAMTLSRKLEYLSIKSMRGRIARFLVEQYKKSGQTTFMLPMNRNELADFLNVSRPSLSRELCRMRDDGLLDFHRFSMQLKDLDALIVEAE